MYSSECLHFSSAEYCTVSGNITERTHQCLSLYLFSSFSSSIHQCLLPSPVVCVVRSRELELPFLVPAPRSLLGPWLALRLQGRFDLPLSTTQLPIPFMFFPTPPSLVSQQERSRLESISHQCNLSAPIHPSNTSSSHPVLLLLHHLGHLGNLGHALPSVAGHQVGLGHKRSVPPCRPQLRRVCQP